MSLITLLITRFPYSSELGGVETFTLDLSRGMRERGVDVRFVGTCRYISDLLKKDGFDVREPWLPKSPVSIGSILLFTLLLPYSLIRSFFLIRQLSIINDQLSLYCLSLADKLLFTFFAHRRGVNVVWGEHESLKNEKGEWRRWMKGNPFFRVIRFLSRYATIVTVSPSLQRQCEELKFQNIKTIPLCVAGQFIEQRTAEREKDGKTLTVGTSARLKEEKGVRELIHVFHMLSNDNPRLRLTVMGDGPERQELEEEVRQGGLETKVTFAGSVPFERMREAYGKLDIAVFLAKQPETFGLAPLEAMSQGIPTLITPWFGFIEGKSEEPFVIVNPSDIDEITSALSPLIHNEEQRKNLSERQRAYVLEKFAPEKSMEAYRRVFERTPSVMST